MAQAFTLSRNTVSAMKIAKYIYTGVKSVRMLHLGLWVLHLETRTVVIRDVLKGTWSRDGAKFCISTFSEPIVNPEYVSTEG